MMLGRRDHPRWHPWRVRYRTCLTPPYPESVGGGPRSAARLLRNNHPSPPVSGC